eukprot:903418-Pyramimonas_sp.AAC.1
MRLYSASSPSLLASLPNLVRLELGAARATSPLRSAAGRRAFVSPPAGLSGPVTCRRCPASQ